MKAHYANDLVTLFHGKAEHLLPTLPDQSVDAVCTDPPYELGFMGRAWDASGIAYSVDLWREVFRVLKPGAHLLAFGGTRTVHRLTCAIEDAGFEIRDGIDWIYGSGFPKSLDVSKAIDKAAGAEREVVGVYASPDGTSGRSNHADRIGTSPRIGGLNDITAPATDAAARWSGWGTALKPAREPIVMARKPLQGTVAANVLEHGTGALNIDGCRIDGRERTDYGLANATRSRGATFGEPSASADFDSSKGRWPTNVVLSHAPLLEDGEPVGDACADGCVPGCPVAELDRQSGVLSSWMSRTNKSMETGNEVFGDMSMSPRRVGPQNQYGDSGGASRFFPVFRYEAKAPTAERPRTPDGTAHPTVKPLDLMRWLVRLVTPPQGVVLDPFAGSGTTGEACAVEGFRCVLVEREAAYLPLITARLSKPLQPTLDLFTHLAKEAS